MNSLGIDRVHVTSPTLSYGRPWHRMLRVPVRNATASLRPELVEAAPATTVRPTWPWSEVKATERRAVAPGGEQRISGGSSAPGPRSPSCWWHVRQRRRFLPIVSWIASWPGSPHALNGCSTRDALEASCVSRVKDRGSWRRPRCSRSGRGPTSPRRPSGARRVLPMATVDNRDLVLGHPAQEPREVAAGHLTSERKMTC